MNYENIRSLLFNRTIKDLILTKNTFSIDDYINHLIYCLGDRLIFDDMTLYKGYYDIKHYANEVIKTLLYKRYLKRAKINNKYHYTPTNIYLNDIHQNLRKINAQKIGIFLKNTYLVKPFYELFTEV